MQDPFPGQELLDRDQVQRLLGFGGETTFRVWLDGVKGKTFPKPIDLGPTPKGRPILRWRKALVLAWLELLAD